MADKKNVESPYTMKDQDRDKKQLKPTIKAYANSDFLNSQAARTIRILCEFQEPMQRLHANGIRGTILVFGSARSMARPDFDRTVKGLKTKLTKGELSDADRATTQTRLDALSKAEWMCPWVEIAEELSARLTKWSLDDKQLHASMHNLPDYFQYDRFSQVESHQPLVITTGGGPGLMEAANRGAASIPGAKSMGMGISLPFEKGLNPYVSDGLEFEFHYFFTRKFWMMYSAKALIVAPGGFGTMDELFELMTLRQTRKIPDLPIVLLCSKFWKTVINWEALSEFGVISQKEVDSLCFADSVDEAFDFIKSHFDNQINSLNAPVSPSTSPAKATSAPPAVSL